MPVADRGRRPRRAYLEKHFTLDRSLPGPDHQASSPPAQLRGLIGRGPRGRSRPRRRRQGAGPNELPVATSARKSLVAARDLAAGAVSAARIS